MIYQKTGIALLVALIACLCGLSAGAQAGDDAYGRFLDTYVVDVAPGVTAVRYGAVSAADHQALKDWIAAQGERDPGAMGRDEAFAYWVNLYNAFTLDVVLDHYPVGSIRDIRFGLGLRAGPWREGLITVGGQRLSLDEIEHGILRKEWDEPRVHFAVNCASVGCPALARQPYSAGGLDAQLDRATREFINTDRAIKVRDDGRLVLSSIFKWYADDFGGNDAAIVTFLERYADEDLRRSLGRAQDIAGYDYDWSLNEAE